MHEYRIAAIPADGIGVEVIGAGLEVLRTAERVDGGFRIQVETFPWGSDYYLEHGRMMPEDGLRTLQGFDAIFFGAVGSPQVPDHITLWGLRLPICQGFDQYANVRPARVLPGVHSPLRNGSAFDIVGKGIANPIATFWTAALMLEHLGQPRAAARLMAAVESVTAQRLFTPDLGDSATTAQVTAAVCGALEKQ